MAMPPSPEPSAEEQALLAAVIAHPDEDTPRLMYADWLDENAAALPTRDPKEARLRAEFIRAQIEVKRLPPDDPGAKALRDRIAELEMLSPVQWYEGARPVFVRGFPIGVWRHELSEICGEAEYLLSRYPIRVIYANEAFSRDTEDEANVVSSPHFVRFTCLGSTSRGWDGDRVAKVLTNPAL
jgi:uncharacterized protein (TIGR02996 family)